MTLENVELFEGISQESIDAMIHCFKAEIRKFRKGDTVIVYSPELEYLCVMLSGKAHLYSVDSEGEDTLLEHYMKDDIFGEVFALPYGSLGYVVEADSEGNAVIKDWSRDDHIPETFRLKQPFGRVK